MADSSAHAPDLGKGRSGGTAALSAPPRVGRARGALEVLVARLRRYRGFVRWLLRDAILRYKGTVTAVILAGTMGVILQVKAIALVLYYASLLEHGETLQVMGRSYVARESPSLLVGFAMACLVALLLSGLLNYFAQSRTFILWQRYAEYCSRRVLTMLAACPRSAPIGPECLNDSSILTIARTDANYCGRVFSLSVGMAAPVLSLAGATAVLVWLNPALTLMLLVLMSVATVFLYRVSVRGAGHSVRMEQCAQDAARQYRDLLRDHKTALTPVPAMTAATQQAFGKGGIRRYIDAYTGRLLAMSESELVSNMFMSGALSSVVLVLGWSVLAQGQGWEHLVAYLVALRYALVMFRTAGQKITSINRFYPQARRYIEFIEASGHGPEPEPAPPPRPWYELAADADVLPGAERRRRIAPGQRAALITPLPLDRVTVAFMMGKLLGHDFEQLRAAMTSTVIAPAEFTGFGAPLRDVVACPAGCRWSDVLELAAEADLRHDLEQRIPEGLDAELTAEQWKSLGAVHRFLLALVPAIHGAAQWVVLDDTGLRLLPTDFRESVLRRLADRIVVIVFTGNIESVGRYEEDIVIVHDGEAVAALGDLSWFRDSRQRVERRLAAAGPRPGDAADDEMDMDPLA